jgi:hypothetical protein
MNGTTPQPQGAVALQSRRAGELMRAALDHYQRRPWTLIALVAVWVFPMGVLNWQAHCGRSRGCRITVLDGVVVSSSWSATTAWVVVVLLALAVVGVLLAVTIMVIAVRLAGEDAAWGRPWVPGAPARRRRARSPSWSSGRRPSSPCCFSPASTWPHSRAQRPNWP